MARIRTAKAKVKTKLAARVKPNAGAGPRPEVANMETSAASFTTPQQEKLSRRVQELKRQENLKVGLQRSQLSQTSQRSAGRRAKVRVRQEKTENPLCASMRKTQH